MKGVVDEYCETIEEETVSVLKEFSEFELPKTGSHPPH